MQKTRKELARAENARAKRAKIIFLLIKYAEIRRAKEANERTFLFVH